MSDPNDARTADDLSAPEAASASGSPAPDANPITGVLADGGEDDDLDDSFAIRVGLVADYLEDNAGALFESAVGRPLDPDDPLLEKLVMGVFARYFLETHGRELRTGKGRRSDLDKLNAARSVVDEAVVGALRSLSGGRLKEIEWRGPGDEQLLAFAYAVAAAWQVGATADALLDMELGLDPDKMDQLTGMMAEFIRSREGEAPEAADERT